MEKTGGFGSHEGGGDPLDNLGMPYKLIRQLNILRKQLLITTGQEPTEAEIEAYLSTQNNYPITEKSVAQRLAAMAIDSDYIFAVEPVDSSTLEVPGPDTTSYGLFVEAEAQERVETLYSYLDQLSERERQVVVARYGLDGEKKTLDEIASVLGVSITRVSQIEVRAIYKLRRMYGLIKRRTDSLLSP